jgi:fructosamine-3-kinase
MAAAQGTADGPIRAAVASALSATVTSARPLGGGDVAESFAMDLDDGRTVFAKTHRSPPPGFFTTEAAGLTWLRDTDAVFVPEVLAVSDGAGDRGGSAAGEVAVPLLVLEWIDVGPSGASGEESFGRQVAAMHRAPWGTFGRPDHRTTGSRALPNEPCDSWAESYAANRLVPLAGLARDAAALPAAVIAGLEDLADRLPELGGAPEPPSLLHGDLWGGNRLVDDLGRSWLIDPAAHGGHREFDLAMMRLFGGFGGDCFSAYDDAHPLAEGWQERVELHQVAPLVVHAIKFGGGYVRAATEAISRYL